MAEPRTPPRTPTEPSADDAFIKGVPVLTAPITQTSPVRSKLAAFEAFQATPLKLNEVHEKLLQETRGHFIGPMPVDTFFDTFMPWGTTDGYEVPDSYKTQKPPKRRHKALVEMSKSAEYKMYGKFIEAFNGWPKIAKSKPFMVPLEIKDSHAHRDKDAKNLGVDISIYSKPFIPRQSESIMDFANCESWVELKSSADSDPFIDPEIEKADADDTTVDQLPAGLHAESGDYAEEEEQPQNDDDDDDNDEVATDSAQPSLPADIAEEPKGHPREIAEDDNGDTEHVPAPPVRSQKFPFENESKAGRSTRAQICCYAGATMATQFRSHLFSIVILGPFARLIRWDRSAAIVTRRFNYTETPYLFEFFRRFAQLSPARRGIHTNVSPATKEDADMARGALKNRGCELWLGRAITAYWDMVNIKTQPFVEYKFDDRTYIVPSPHCDEYSISPFGRSSRARLAVDRETKEPKYLKDCWRDKGGKNTVSEAEVYRRLKENDVENVANMEHGGDTKKATLGHEWAAAPWVHKQDLDLRVREMVEHVVVLNTIGRSLSTFRTARQLLSCIADAMEGYEQALAKAKIMHRDISAGNIVMVPDEEKDVGWRGTLIDWDHSVLYGEDREGSRILRTGTWQFLSARLGEDPQAIHTPLDDRESSIYVLVWICLRYLKHSLSGQNVLLQQLAVFDNAHADLEQHAREGRFKAKELRSDFGDVKFPDLIPVTRAIQALCRVYSVRYTSKPELAPVEDKMAALLGGNKTLLQAELLNLFEMRERQLSDPTFIPNVLRGYAEQLPLHKEPPKRTDWVDNLRVLKERQRDPYDPDLSDYYPPRSGLMFAYTHVKYASGYLTPQNEVGRDKVARANGTGDEGDDRAAKRTRQE